MARGVGGECPAVDAGGARPHRPCIRAEQPLGDSRLRIPPGTALRLRLRPGIAACRAALRFRGRRRTAGGRGGLLPRQGGGGGRSRAGRHDGELPHSLRALRFQSRYAGAETLSRGGRRGFGQQPPVAHAEESVCRSAVARQEFGGLLRPVRPRGQPVAQPLRVSALCRGHDPRQPSLLGGIPRAVGRRRGRHGGGVSGGVLAAHGPSDRHFVQRRGGIPPAERADVRSGRARLSLQRRGGLE